MSMLPLVNCEFRKIQTITSLGYLKKKKKKKKKRKKKVSQIIPKMTEVGMPHEKAQHRCIDGCKIILVNCKLRTIQIHCLPVIHEKAKVIHALEK